LHHGANSGFESSSQVMYKTKSMKRAIFALVSACCLLATGRTHAQETSTTEPVSVAKRAAGLKRHDGFLPFYWDEKKDAFLLELSPSALSREFLYFIGMGSGVGSTEVFADRSSFAESALCRFRRAGTRVLVIQENPGFRAQKGSAELQQSVEASFPTSVLAAMPIEAEQDGTLLVKANSLIIRDAADLVSQLKHRTVNIAGRLVQEDGAGASWHLDAERSVLDADHTGSFPLNTEVEALLTFSGDSENDFNQPNAHTLSVREHHSFVALPAAGFEPREADPRVGFSTLSFKDFSQPFDQPLARYLVHRWRLQKKDPAAAVSEPVKPIVLYLDRAIPEPVRSAAKRGALWWNDAFEQAGFKNALRVEDLPAGADPLDIRYPSIQWTNRSGRGWSVGMSHVDPRTGEIIHAVVQLDSHRMRTAANYWRAIVTPAGGEPTFDLFAALDDLDPQLNAEQAMANRMALLTCHEVGHILGLDHNFVASTYGRGSVMDYFAPRVHLRSDGTADLSDAYMQGTGSYDRAAIEWGYAQGKPGATAEQEHARLDALVRANIAKGIVWGNYDDPRWNAYDDGPDPIGWLREMIPVRDILLAHYGPQMLRPGEPNSMLASRFPLLYLFHRYALAAVINVIGGAKVPLSLAGDGQAPVTPWPAVQQQAALQMVLQALNPTKLDVPPEMWKLLAPVENRDADPERFNSSAGYLFSPQDGARAVADVVVGGLLNRERMQRLAVLSHQDSAQLSPARVIAQLVTATFASGGSGQGPREDIAGVLQTEVAERLMLLSVDAEATPEVQGAALVGVREVQREIKDLPGPSAALQRLDHNITLFLLDPRQNVPKPKSSGAPPGPPV
jgi:hypothetical protein